jgi:predicted metal-dependent peptidase
VEENMKANERITKAKIRIQERSPFFAYLVLHLRVKEAKEIQGQPIPTMAIDKFGNMYYNPDFVDTLSDEECIAVVLHECLHCAFCHLDRLSKRNPEIWNFSTDLVINDLLRANGFHLPKGCIGTDDEHEVEIGGIKIQEVDRKTAEIIYDLLMSKAKKVSYAGFDSHLNTKDGEGKGEGKKGGKEGEGLSKGEVTDWTKVLCESVEYAKQRGNLPAGIERFVGELLNPKIAWKQMLNKYITNTMLSDFTYTRPSRRSVATGIYLPSMKREEINVVVAVDTSGSIGQAELTEFMSEIVGISKSFNNIKIVVIVCDAEITEVVECKNGHREDLEALQMKGGGGTAHQPVFSYISENLPDTKLLVGLTDGFSDIECCEEPNYPVLWVISEGGKTELPFGEVVRLEE